MSSVPQLHLRHWINVTYQGVFPIIDLSFSYSGEQIFVVSRLSGHYGVIKGLIKTGLA